MTKSVRKAVMTHSKLQNKNNKDKTLKNWMIFKKQKKKCVKILRNVKRKYLSNFNIKYITNKMQLW